MKWLRTGIVRLRSLFRREQMDRELDAELASHLEMHVADNLRGGMTPEAARRDALIKLGGVEQTKESYRDRRDVVWLENLGGDLRFGIRLMARNRGLSLVAIFALALGIGATTVMFSVVQNVFFNALPYKNFNRLVVIKVQNLANAGGWKERDFFTPEELAAFRAQNHVFEEAIFYNGIRLIYDNGKTSRYWGHGELVTSNAFDFLGVSAFIGRGIRKEDGLPSADPVFVMHYRKWQREFGGDPKILNTKFILNGVPTMLVGIMSPRFNAFAAEFWLPMTDKDGDGQLMGRLKPGISLEAAGADFDAIAHRLQKANPGGPFPLPEKFEIVPQTLLDSMIGQFRKTLYALFASVLLLLLIACANVANLLLARATAREREIAMRSVLGATRVRLIRQLLAESFILAVSASIFGCALAYFALRIVVALIPAGTLPEETVIRLNTTVLFLAIGVTIATAILCGLAPAFHAVGGDLQRRIAGSGKGAGGNFRFGRLRAGLVLSEVALSIVLLTSAGLLMRSFLVLTRVDLGFDPKNVLYFRLSLPKAYNTDVDVTGIRKNTLTRQILERLEALPGVVSASESMLEPPLEYDWSDTIIPGKPHSERWESRIEFCSGSYFKLLGLPLMRGRLFSEADMDAARFVMVVNESFARQYFPNEDPIGHKVKLEVLDRPFLGGPRDAYFEIVGIVGDIKTRDFDNPAWRAFPQTSVPYSVQGFSHRTYMARTAMDPAPLLKNMTKEMQAIDPGLEMATSGTLEGALREFYRKPQFELVTLGTFAMIGLLLVAIGIFSVMAYTVSLQTREIGIRMAVGARREDILGMVLATSLRLVGGGVAIGLLISYAAGRYLASEISGIPVTDRWTYGAVVIVVAAVGLLASFLPARRAARVDPMVALRYE